MLTARRTRAFLAVALLVLAELVAIAPNASAVRTFRLPWAPGTTWYVCQGYNGPISHAGTRALDLSSDRNSASGSRGCSPSTSNASTNKAVVAPADGTVRRATASDQICIDFGRGAGSMLIGHLKPDSLVIGAVRAGATIGKVAAPNASNGQYAHIHIQYHSANSCGGSSTSFASANNSAFRCAIDMPSNGSGNQYRGTALTACRS